MKIIKLFTLYIIVFLMNSCLKHLPLDTINNYHHYGDVNVIDFSKTGAGNCHITITHNNPLFKTDTILQPKLIIKRIRVSELEYATISSRLNYNIELE